MRKIRFKKFEEEYFKESVTSMFYFGFDEGVHLMHVAGDPHEPHGEGSDNNCN